MDLIEILHDYKKCTFTINLIFIRLHQLSQQQSVDPFESLTLRFIVYWKYEEWEDLVRLPLGDIPRPIITSLYTLAIPVPILVVYSISCQSICDTAIMTALGNPHQL
jgi:hypothetical protein